MSLISPPSHHMTPHDTTCPQDARQMRVTPLTLALLLALSTTAAAQDSNTDDQAATLDSVKVTAIGTNIEGIQPVGSKSMALEREAMTASGLGSISDVMRSLPQIQNNDAFSEGGTAGDGGGNLTQGTTLNLRGIGSSATLLLIDGRRVAMTGTQASFTEANQVPMIALERVEVIADGASAIYGSDAVAGIVNYVLRKDYEGVEASLRFSDEGGFHQRVGSLLAGVAWNALGGGNLVFAYERTERDALVAGKNPRLRQDQTRYGGLDWRVDGRHSSVGFNANIVVPRADRNPEIPQANNWDYWSVPAGSDGVGLTAADLILNRPNLIDGSDYIDYVGKMLRDQYSLFFQQQVTERVSFYSQILHRERSVVSHTMDWPTRFTEVMLPASSPYYISGIPGVAPGETLMVHYNAYKDLGRAQHFRNNENQTTWTAGIKLELGADWKGDVSWTDSENTSCGWCVPRYNTNWSAFNAQVAAGNINPLSNQPLSAAQIASFTGINIQRNISTLKDALVKFNGPLFDLPGGKVRAAVGAGYSESEMEQFNFANRAAGNIDYVDTAPPESRIGRELKSLFTEVYVPVIGEGNAVPGIKSLSLVGALRHDRYSDVGTTTNPKLGLTWDVNDALSLRGSWGKSFRAPNLLELNPWAFSNRGVNEVDNNSGDPAIIDGVSPGRAWQLYVVGANTNLRPETAKTWSAGFDYVFSAIDGLRLSATYYHIAYENRIATPELGEYYASPEGRATWAAYIIPVQNPAGCLRDDPSTWDPVMRQYMDLPVLYGNLGRLDTTLGFNQENNNPCQTNVISDGRNTNLSATEQAGLDIELNWAIPSEIGFWNLSAATTRVLKHEQQLAAGLPKADRRGLYNEPSSIRARGNLGWYLGDWGVNLFANYVGSYTNDLPITWAGVRRPAHRVGSWTTWDLGVQWSQMVEAAWLHEIRVGFNVNNVFDRDPPIVLSGNRTFNPSKSNPFGRTWAVTVALSY